MIDDIGYVRKDEAETSVLFELVKHRYERRSLLVADSAGLRSQPPVGGTCRDC